MSQQERRYDDSAFVYFALSVLVIILIPTTLSYVKKWRKAFSSHYGGLCGCDACRIKAKNLQVQSRRPGFVGAVKFILWALLWVVFIYLVFSVSQKDSEAGTTTQFDPYEILGLSPGADEDEIKKAYRKLSLMWHPDKNPSEEAADKYITISKAYNTLTDPAVREKWEKYGNPDGPQAMFVGIALPSFLVDSKNSYLVLGLYVVFLVIVFPSIAIWFWQRQKELAPNQVNRKTMMYFFQVLRETMRFKFLIDVMSLTYEYVTQIQLRRGDEPYLMKIKTILPEEDRILSKSKKKAVPPHAIKNKMLFFAHFNRAYNMLSPAMRADLDIILGQVHQLLGGLVEIAISKRWLIPTIEAIQLGQMATQAVWGESARVGRNTEFLQFPHFTEDLAKKLAKKKITTVVQFVTLDSEKRRELLLEEKFTDSQIQDVEYVVKQLPADLEFTFKNTVDEDDEELGVTGGAIVTMKLELSRPSKPQSVNTKEQPPVEVHAPFLPIEKTELWWAIIGDDRTQRIMGLKKILSLRDGMTVDVPFLAPPKAGDYTFTLYILSDSYSGFDKKQSFTLHVTKELPPPPKSENPEDEEELENEEEFEEEPIEDENQELEDEENESDPDQPEDSMDEGSTPNKNDKRKDKKKK
mmetsp:Transcript_24128/g.33831  ORF Transcript_24128/g.33831 Transcript_24128/m.33831 type:complete len:637 (+) Transcript_24128:93-2003(+)